MNVDLRARPAEQRLIKGALAGSGEAFAALFRAHHAGAMRIAASFVRSTADAEDVVQEAFVKAWRAIDRFEPGSPFGPWLGAIVANEARTHLRAGSRRAAAHARLEEHLRRTAEPAPPVEAPLLAGEDRDRLDGALAELAPDDRRIIRMRYELGLGEAEMAAALEVPRGTVKSRLSRALARLRQHVVVVILVLAALTAAAVPPVRAAIGRLLGVTGAEKVVSVPRLPADLSPRPFEWGPVVDPGELGRLDPFRSGPPAFGGIEPQVRLRTDLARPMLTLVYGRDTATIVSGIGPLVLAKLIPRGARVRRVAVPGGRGLWIPGGTSHALAALDRRHGYLPGPKTRIDSGVLALEGPDGRDYRIQTDDGLRHALDLARALYSRAEPRSR